MQKRAFAESLHQSALQAVSRYLRAEAELLEILQKIDQERAYRELGYSSLYQYSVNALKLSESVAYNFINVSRKARQVPALQKAISSGALSVSKARKIVPVLTLGNQEEWIDKAKTLPQKKLEKEVARIAPRELAPERASYVTEVRLELRLGVSERLMQALKRAQDLESQRTQKAATLEETLEALAELYLSKNDPLQKKPKSVLVARQALQDGKRTPIPAALERAVAQRDGGQCTHVGSNGISCGQTRWLQIHHIQPVSEGGTHSLENLATLCSAHHQGVHAEASQTALTSSPAAAHAG